MKLLMDECILAQTTRLLKSNGCNVRTIQELGKASSSDDTVISLAKKEKAVLLTNDLDFSNLVLYPPASHFGVIVLRPRLDTPGAIEDIHKILLHLLKELKPSQIEHALVIVDKDKYRIRKE